MENLNYWDKFYSKVYNTLPSQFAIFVANEYKGNNTLIDFGCGSGRDTFFFSKIYKNVIGIDSSNKVIEKNILKKKEKHLNFINDDLLNPQKLEKFINEKLSQSDLNIFYGRFFLHAVDENIENIFLNLFKNLNYKNNLLALEFRTSKDEFLEKEFNNHYRRYIDIKNFKKKLKNFDIKIKYFTEGQGYAKFKSDDAYVARVIAY